MRVLPLLAASLSLIAGAAVAQTDEPGGHHRHHMQSRSPGAAFSLDRGAGEGKIEIRCAGRDTTRDCVEAVLPLLDALSPDGAPGQGSSPGVAYATNSIKCGDTVYEVSTGTKGGACGVSVPETGPAIGTSCTDGSNQASASCKRGCGTTTGAGSCTIKAVP